MFNTTENGQNRIDERLDVVWEATAIIDDKEYACEVSNVSTAGVLLVLDIDIEEKHQFLLNVEELNEYAVEVAWANRPNYGLVLIVGDDLKLKDHADRIGLTAKKKS
ncbi:MAG: hypothetical protein COB54_01795 [Alphaproteobacteria bacterium]|nr:MAG: hypothetical protein COB54_01795 [Alphaproteobacteria bacterium]